MRTPTPADMFVAWEAALPQPTVARALILAALVAPDDAVALARLSVGERDEWLITLRARAFGPRLQGQVRCPACAAELELTIDVDALQSLSRGTSGGPFTLDYGGFHLTVRLPTSADLLTLEGTDVAANTKRLLRRCVSDVRKKDGQAIRADELPDRIVAAISRHLSEADPLGDVTVSTVCAACGHHWDAPFDIASFLWSEMHAWACRMLRDIHALASAYGWRERDVLAISPLRRRAYLDLIGA